MTEFRHISSPLLKNNFWPVCKAVATSDN